MKTKVTVWNEFRHEKIDSEVSSLYPEGLHGTIKNFLDEDQDFDVRTATLDEPEHGLTDEVLNTTDVLIWWGHMAHDLVRDEVVEKVYQRVLSGMGLIVLHSGHYSKIFTKLMGTSCSLKWRQVGLKVEKFLEVDVALIEAMVKYSISDPVMNLIQPFIISKYRKLLKML